MYTIIPSHFNATAAQVAAQAENLCLSPIIKDGKVLVNFSNFPPQLQLQARATLFFCLGLEQQQSVNR